MKVKEEIEKYASALDRPILEWLFARYHLESKWRFVAKGTFYKYGTQSNSFRIPNGSCLVSIIYRSLQLHT